jgi:hypothetical protein
MVRDISLTPIAKNSQLIRYRYQAKVAARPILTQALMSAVSFFGRKIEVRLS